MALFHMDFSIFEIILSFLSRLDLNHWYSKTTATAITAVINLVINRA